MHLVARLVAGTLILVLLSCILLSFSIASIISSSVQRVVDVELMLSAIIGVNDISKVSPQAATFPCKEGRKAFTFGEIAQVITVDQ